MTRKMAGRALLLLAACAATPSHAFLPDMETFRARYLLARAIGLHAGLDVARGPEKTAFYLIVGSAWR
jgi:hypothetical protein